jgi:hypothetical protein
MPFALAAPRASAPRAPPARFPSRRPRTTPRGGRGARRPPPGWREDSPLAPEPGSAGRKGRVTPGPALEELPPGANDVVLPADDALVVGDDPATYADLEAEERRAIARNGGGAVLNCSRAFTATVRARSVRAAKKGRGVADYVRLPAEEYNVLDSDAVTRVAENTFRVAAGAQKILFLEVEPVGLLEIKPTADGCEQLLKGAEMRDVKAARTGAKPNAIIAGMNASLRDLRMRNRLQAVTKADGATAIQCQIDIAGRFTEGPFAAAGSDRLNGVLAWCLGAVMPWFLNQLSDDYDDWCVGKPRGRKDVNVSAVAQEILNGGMTGKLPEGVAEVKPAPSSFQDA